MTKETKDIVGFEMDAFDGVVVTAALNGGPVGDGGAATVSGHGLGMGGEGNDARTVVEFDEADFYIVSGRGGFALGIEAVNFEVIFAMIDDGAGKGKQGRHVFGEAHVFESAGIIFG